MRMSNIIVHFAILLTPTFVQYMMQSKKNIFKWEIGPDKTQQKK